MASPSTISRVTPPNSSHHSDDFTITELTTPDSVFLHLEQLSSILQQCVHEGHSMGFLAPLPTEEARTYWIDLIPQIEKRSVHLFVLMTSPPPNPPTLVGTVQLAGMPKATHLHRSDVNKLIISSEYQRRGLARKLMEHVVEFARQIG